MGLIRLKPGTKDVARAKPKPKRPSRHATITRFQMARHKIHPCLSAVLTQLSNAGLPVVLLMLLGLVCESMTQPLVTLACAEIFAGCKSITGGFRSLDYRAVSFELDDRAVYEDFLSGIGFAYAVALLIRVCRYGGVYWMAPVCSTWVWVNRGTSRRSQQSPLGDESVPSVFQANQMVCRCCLCALICCLLKVPWVLEQPGSSLLEWHPYFQLLCKRFKIFRAFVWVGSYGGGSPKPTLLYSNYPWIQQMYLPLPKHVEWDAEMSRKYIDGSGIQRVCGGADLKHSQYYPKLFGHGFAQLYAKHEHEVRKEVRQQAKALEDLKEAKHRMKDGNWSKDANLAQVIFDLKG